MGDCGEKAQFNTVFVTSQILNAVQECQSELATHNKFFTELVMFGVNPFLL